MLYVDDTIGNFSMEDVERYLSVVSLQRAELVKSFAFCIDKERSLKAYRFQTNINKKKGYVITTCSYESSLSSNIIRKYLN